MGRSLYITKYGAFIGKSGNRIVVKLNDRKEEYVPDDLEDLIIVGRGKSISSDVVKLCVEAKIPIFFTTMGEYPYATVMPMTISGTVKRRRAQYEAYISPLGIEIAKKFLVGKLYNQMNLLRLWAKSRMRSDKVGAAMIKKAANTIKDLLDSLKSIAGERMTGEIREKLMSLEARAADIYWIWFGRILGDVAFFPGRVKRGAMDPVNSLLNLGYAILFRRVFKAVLINGLDPYAGFLHADRSGRASLVLDLMEEFRQQVVDRVVLRLFTKKMIRYDECVNDEGRLRDNVVATAIKEFENRLSEEVTTIYGEKRSIIKHINNQARSLARFLIGDIPEYRPFVLSW
ncbi:MAG: CRISPR-associated endonuclease Cas1 [Candidatus Njordarchaeales archaeon]